MACEEKMFQGRGKNMMEVGLSPDKRDCLPLELDRMVLQIEKTLAHFGVYKMVVQLKVVESSDHMADVDQDNDFLPLVPVQETLAKQMDAPSSLDPRKEDVV
ncbi:hypothetical protein DPEC_G00125380 [Dallia pectoralis]|uniref:Uncharacterized protein n=1 Tax=Dallia pectoralis TaxID=75939 RepID=A0ACC2GRG8_DALPE|nr:hypothetical protein DPEC_G00125380 [Dallia pectoralis]